MAVGVLWRDSAISSSVVQLYGPVGAGGPESPGETGSLFPAGAPEVPAAPDTPGPAPAEKPPEDSGTKPWRKSWRRRWRPGSTFRKLSPVAMLVTIWVEDNADDDGVVVTTTRAIADTLDRGGQGRKRMTPMTIWRALQEMQELQIVKVEGAGSCYRKSLQKSLQEPSKITRLNYRDYQDPVPEVVTGSRYKKLLRSSRRRRTEVTTSPDEISGAAPKKPGRKKDPTFVALLDAMRQEYVALKGEALDVPPNQLGDLRAVRSAIGDDAEVLRRWGRFIRDQFWPAKNLNRFRAAFGKYARKQSGDPGCPPVPGLENY